MPRRNDKGRRTNEIPARKVRTPDQGSPWPAKYEARSQRVQRAHRSIRG